MATSPLSLGNIVSVSVVVNNQAAQSLPFNQLLFIGNSTVIPSYGTNSRLRQYSAATYSTAMLADGFTVNSPEYEAATVYFSQSPQPGYIWIGRQDGTAINTATVDVGGTGWQVGDQFVIGSASNYAIGEVTAVNSGVVTAFSVIQQGTGFSVSTAIPCTAIAPSNGTGLEINITTIGETLLQAAVACRAANSLWYGLALFNAQEADILAVAAWADANWETVRYYARLSDPQVLTSSTTDIASQLAALKYRVECIYATTQGGLYPNNIYADVALGGMEMGRQTGLAGSFFDSAHKTLSGISAEPLTQAQYTSLLSKNCNAVGNFQNSYSVVEPGVVSSGDPAYLWMYLAILVNQLQIDLMNVLVTQPVVQQSNAGQQLLLGAADQACQYVANIGFLSPGTWEGPAINIPGVTLSIGQVIPNGFLNQSQPFSQQSAGDRAAGKAMPIYCAITTSGAVRSLLIGVYTQI